MPLRSVGRPSSGGVDVSASPAGAATAAVRRATVNDAPAVGVVQAAVFRAAYAGRIPDEVAATFEAPAFARSWREALTAPPAGAHALFVATADAQVVGVAATGPSQDEDSPPERGEVTLLAVHPQARRQGHGSRLLHAAADHLAACGAQELACWVLVDDEATRAFVHAAGLGPDGARRDRVVGPEGQLLREVRLLAALDSDPS